MPFVTPLAGVPGDFGGLIFCTKSERIVKIVYQKQHAMANTTNNPPMNHIKYLPTDELSVGGGLFVLRRNSASVR